MNRYDLLAIRAHGRSQTSLWSLCYCAYRSSNLAQLSRELGVHKGTGSRWAAAEFMRKYVLGCAAQPGEHYRVRKGLTVKHYAKLTEIFRHYEFSREDAFGFLQDTLEAKLTVEQMAVEVTALLNGDPGDMWHDYKKYGAWLRKSADDILRCPQEFREDALVLAGQMRELGERVKGRIG